jgi:hypothetical protein
MTYEEIQSRVRNMDFQQFERETGIPAYALEHLCSDEQSSVLYPWFFRKVAEAVAPRIEVPLDAVMAAYRSARIGLGRTKVPKVS